MYFFITSPALLLACFSVSLAEPPRWRGFQRIQTSPPTSTPAASYGPPPTPAASYGPPPIPAASYGPPPTPAASYGPPPAESYGPPGEDQPSLTTTEPATDVATATEVDAELIGQSGQLQSDKGSYYIYHPSGLLQKVTYAKNKASGLKLKYENVEPVNGPVYTYDPITLRFQKI